MNTPSLAAATGAQKNELILFYTLLELTIIVIAGRAGGALARRIGQSAAVGEIIVGILLGPSLFGLLAPHAFDFVFHSAPPEPLTVLSNLGLVLLMFQIGMEFDFSHLTEAVNRAAVLRISIACLTLPFAGGFGLGMLIAHGAPPAARINTALFVATALSITALPTLGRIMMELNLTRTRVGVIAVSAAAVNDVVGWLLLALVTTLTVSEFVPSRFVIRVAMVAAFGLVSVLLVRPLLKKAIRKAPPRNGKLSANLLGGILAVIFIAAMTTYQIGIFAIFGGFMMGVILYDETDLVAAWRDRLGDFVTVFFLPIFFTYTGLRTSIGGLDTSADWLWCAAIIAVATVTKLAGAYVMARRCGLDHPQSAMIGFMMNTRALMELIVLNVGLDLGVISPKLFTMLVIMAILSTIITTPALRYFMPRAGLELQA
ncbi:MAG TPA: cation:proton antiporter [Steroidobacteraceae bacterium]|nr:cation:proton antiporter [Steroidobacteraceae bacterium]